MSEHVAVPPAGGESSDDGFIDAREAVRRRISGVIDRVTLARREIARWQAEEAAALAAAGEASDELRDTWSQAAEREMSLRSVAAALGAATRQSDRSVQRQIGDALRLVRDLPGTFAAFAAGDISRGHVMAVMDATQNLSDSDALSVVDDVGAELSRREAPARVRAALRTAADEVNPRGLVERHQCARAGRGIAVVDLPDAMAQLVATVPAVLAKGIDDRLSQQAHVLKDHETAARATGDAAQSEVRTIGQIKADLFADLLLTSSPGADPTVAERAGGLGAIRGIVQVDIPIEILRVPGAGAGETAPDAAVFPAPAGAVFPAPAGAVPAPARADGDRGAACDPVAEIPGFGPIDDDSARALAAAAPGWDLVYRAARDGFDASRGGGRGGEVIQVGRYRRSAEMERFLRARDEHCRFPGCRMPIHRCDCDHTIDAALGGATATDNLAYLCRRHHSLKQAVPAWTVRQLSGGVLEWTSPFGATYTDVPPGIVRFEPPPF